MTARRVLLRHTAGPYPGLLQFSGLFTTREDADLPKVLPQPPIPDLPMWPDRRRALVWLEVTKPRYVVYREQEAGPDTLQEAV